MTMKPCKKCKIKPEFQYGDIGQIRLVCLRCRKQTHVYEAFAPQNIGAAIDAAVAEWDEMNTDKEE